MKTAHTRRTALVALSLSALALATLAMACSSNAGGSKAQEPVAGNARDTTGTTPWPLSLPAGQGMNPVMLDGADQKILADYPNVYSLLVIRHGHLVYEKYYRGMGATDANPVYSVTKSVMSALTGIAMRDGLLAGVDTKLSALLPESFAALDDPQKRDITIGHALTMTGGLASIDSDYYSYFTSRDFLDYALQRTLLAEPGKLFSYNTGLTHLLSVAIGKQSGMDVADYADRHLFGPLGITRYRWDTDRQGRNVGGSGLSLTPRDMAKLGYLYLHEGNWEGRQLIPADWVRESIRRQLAVDTQSGYGYLFWNWEHKANALGTDHYAWGACGAGGQYVIVVPDLDLVAVVTADYNSYAKGKADTIRIIWDWVVPAVEAP